MPKKNSQLRVSSFSSKGESSRIKSNFDGSIIHTFSKLETNFFSLLRYAPKINNVKSQVLLDVDDTIQIAEELNIKHPWNNKKNTAAIMSTDFIVECSGCEKYAITIKYSTQLTKRVIEKFDIENSYWKNRGYEFFIFTEQEVDETKLYNAHFIHDYFDSIIMEYQKPYFYQLKTILNASIENSNSLTIKDANHIISNKLQIDFSTGLRCFKYLLATNRLTYNPQIKLDIFNIIN